LLLPTTRKGEEQSARPHREVPLLDPAYAAAEKKKGERKKKSRWRRSRRPHGWVPSFLPQCRPREKRRGEAGRSWGIYFSASLDLYMYHAAKENLLSSEEPPPTEGKGKKKKKNEERCAWTCPTGAFFSFAIPPTTPSGVPDLKRLRSKGGGKREVNRSARLLLLSLPTN